MENERFQQECSRRHDYCTDKLQVLRERKRDVKKKIEEYDNKIDTLVIKRQALEYSLKEIDDTHKKLEDLQWTYYNLCTLADDRKKIQVLNNAKKRWQEKYPGEKLLVPKKKRK